VTALVLIERYIAFRLELHNAKHQSEINRVVILGTDSVAAHLKVALKNEPRLRTRVVAFLKTTDAPPDPAIPADLIKGRVDDLEKLIEVDEVDKVILSDSSLPHAKMVQIILLCERAMVSFQMIPDMFRLLTTKVDMQSIGDIPVLGVSKWPLDYFWNRVMKRGEDIVGSLVGLLISAPVIAVAAVSIRRDSPGPVFFRQVRCGENGREFTLYKLRTMHVGAESETGPVWATQDDPRRTKAGVFLRRYNVDELPQFWNVLHGDMSLVGPRPERPHFVEQFKEDISKYMWRHVSKPGMTGWAQVNGLRGNTSISERIQYDLYYLENWSLSFDFKILTKTFFVRENAY
jgi:exopolysaccharide biosynthesis polyprenyl glycosylphosphotransferase